MLPEISLLKGTGKLRSETKSINAGPAFIFVIRRVVYVFTMCMSLQCVVYVFTMSLQGFFHVRGNRASNMEALAPPCRVSRCSDDTVRFLSRIVGMSSGVSARETRKTLI